MSHTRPLLVATSSGLNAAIRCGTFRARVFAASHRISGDVVKAFHEPDVVGLVQDIGQSRDRGS